jgi:hypothetical protein
LLWGGLILGNIEVLKLLAGIRLRIYWVRVMKSAGSWRWLKMPLESVRLTASFKPDGPLPQDLSSTYRGILNHLLDHAWARGTTSFKRLKSIAS